MVNMATELVKNRKNVWVASNKSVAVYSASNSGAPEFTTITRLKGGLKELGESFRKPMAEKYDAINGAKSWIQYLTDYSNPVENRWSGVLFI